MKPLPTRFIEQRRILDYMLLLICPAMVSLFCIIVITLGYDDIVKTYAYVALIVQLLICYLPTRLYLKRFGINIDLGLCFKPKAEWFLYALLAIGAYLFLLPFNRELYRLLRFLGMTELIELEIPGGWRFFAYIFLVAILPAITEMSMLNGALLFTRLPYNRFAAILHSAALFSLIQLQPFYFPPLLLIGLLLAHISEKAKSCCPAMVFYATYSIFSIMLSYAASRELFTLPQNAWFLSGFGLIVGLAAYYSMIRSMKKRQAASINIIEKLNTIINTFEQAEFLSQEYMAQDEEYKGVFLHQSDENDVEADLLCNAQEQIQRAFTLQSRVLTIVTYMFLFLLNGLYLAMLFIY